MRKRATSLLCIIVLLCVSYAIIASVRADYLVRITEGNVSVEITGNFAEGVPNAKGNASAIFASIPVFHSALQGANVSLLTTELKGAIMARAPAAGVSNVKFNAISNGTSMSYQLSFMVTNVSRTTYGSERVSLAWRNFVIAQDFGANGVSINNVVSAYLQDSILTQTRIGGSSSGGVTVVRTWYVNDQAVPANQVPTAVKNMALFNFSSLNQPLSGWQSQRDVSNSKIELQATSGFNVTYTVRITEVESVTTSTTNVVNRLKVLVDSPLPRQVTDNELVFDAAGFSWIPQLMVVSTIAGIALLVGTYLAERRLRPETRRPQTRRKKS